MYKENLNKTINSKKEKNISSKVDYTIISEKDGQDQIQGKEIRKRAFRQSVEDTASRVIALEMFSVHCDTHQKPQREGGGKKKEEFLKKQSLYKM